MPKKENKKSKSSKKVNETKIEETPVPVTSTHPIGRVPGDFLSLDKKLIIIAVIGIALLLLFTFKLNGFSSFLSDNEVVVTVNGYEITEEDIQEELSNLPSYYLSAGVDEETLRNAVIDQLIAKQLLEQQAKELGVTVTDEEIQETIDTLMQEAGLTQEEFDQRLKEQGLTEESLTSLVKDQIAINKVIEDQALSNIEITEDEIQNYFDETEDLLLDVRASHILICYGGALKCEQTRSKEEAYDLASSIIEMIKQGNDFGELAVEHSDDPSAELNSGDLGWFTKGQMVPEFEAVAFSLNAGEMAPVPIETDYGYHIIYVIDKKETLEDVKDEIVQTLTFDKQQIVLEEYIETLKEAANIKFE